MWLERVWFAKSSISYFLPNPRLLAIGYIPYGLWMWEVSAKTDRKYKSYSRWNIRNSLAFSTSEFIYTKLISSLVAKPLFYDSSRENTQTFLDNRETCGCKYIYRYKVRISALDDFFECVWFVVITPSCECAVNPAWQTRVFAVEGQGNKLQKQQFKAFDLRTVVYMW